MAEGVVDFLEVIEVDAKNGNLLIVATGHRQRLMQAVPKQHPVGQVGQ